MFERIRIFFRVWWFNWKHCSVGLAWWIAGNQDKFCDGEDGTI